jgi:hypothetical protein
LQFVVWQQACQIAVKGSQEPKPNEDERRIFAKDFIESPNERRIVNFRRIMICTICFLGF